jgi:hypothetical protein
MSFDTRITERLRSNFSKRCITTARIWLSPLAVGRAAGSCTLMASVCRNRRPLASSLEGPRRLMPSSMPSGQVLTISSRLRLAWRALRATSDMPFLLESSSSRVIIGTKMSCSSKRNRLVGSCISTLVSRTNSLVEAILDFAGRRVAMVVGFLGCRGSGPYRALM